MLSPWRKLMLWNVYILIQIIFCFSSYHNYMKHGGYGGNKYLVSFENVLAVLLPHFALFSFEPTIFMQ